MKQKILGTLLVGAALVLSPAAFAAEDGAEKPKFDREAFKNLSPEERQKFFEERKAKWEALSRDEKLKSINERHDEMRKKMDDHWNSLSDDDKLKFAEERMSGKHKGKFGKHRRGGDDAPPPPGDDMPPPKGE